MAPAAVKQQREDEIVKARNSSTTTTSATTKISPITTIMIRHSSRTLNGGDHDDRLLISNTSKLGHHRFLSTYSSSLLLSIRPWMHLILLLLSTVVLNFPGSSSVAAYNSSNSSTTRQSAIPDTKGCCRSKGVSEYCLEKMCDTSRPPDEFDVFEVANDCTGYLSSMAECLSDGRNHTSCCRGDSKGTDDLCMHLCDGTPYYFNVSMWEEYKGYVACLTFNAQSIFDCVERGYSIAPGRPTRLQILSSTSTGVQLKWSPPSVQPDKAVRYSVHYAPIPEPGRRYVGWKAAYRREDVVPSTSTSTRFELGRLTPDTRYDVYVVARGESEDAASLPSDSVQFVTDGVASKAEPYKARVESPAGLPASLICLITGRGGGERENLRVHWYYSADSETPIPVSTSGRAKYQQIVRIVEDPNPSAAAADEVDLAQQGRGTGTGTTTAPRRTYVAAITLNRVTEQDFGVYKCTASTPFGDSSARVELVRPADQQRPVAAAGPQQPPNVTECCVREGVQPRCMTSCQSNVEDSTAVSLFQGSSSCGQDLPKILRCAVGGGGTGTDQYQQRDGGGHCCLRRGVPLSCLFLCDSTRPMASSRSDLFACIQYTNELLQCLAESKQYLPPPPRDLRIKQVTNGGATITVEWTQHDEQQDPPAPAEVPILAYHVYYRKRQQAHSDQGPWRRVTSTASSVTITDLARNSQYVVVAVSANAAGISDPSRPLYFNNGAGRLLRDQPQQAAGQRRRKSRNNVRHHHHQQQHFHSQHHHTSSSSNHQQLAQQQQEASSFAVLDEKKAK